MTSTSASMQAVIKWFASKYPNFAFHPEWIEGCVDFIQSQGCSSNPELIKRVHHELLSDDLAKTVSPSPSHLAHANKLLPPPSPTTCVLNSKLLLQINEIVEIGHPALSMLEVANERREEEEEMRKRADGGMMEVGAVTKRFPRQMLKFRLGDGLKEVKAIEYERIDELELGDAKVGMKLLVTGAMYKNGILFLTPKNTKVVGGGIKEWDSDQLLRQALEARLEAARHAPTTDVEAEEETKKKKRVAPRKKSTVKARDGEGGQPKRMTQGKKKAAVQRRDSDVTGWMEEEMVILDSDRAQVQQTEVVEKKAEEDYEMDEWDDAQLEEVDMILSQTASQKTKKTQNVILLDSD
ncbi:hypothetical protein BT69DRAFT_1349315 [Atractiella rhizophila]|nr:hypothetical protein BT69DRAFT_1349315 [Atractiella rhizophila]